MPNQIILIIVKKNIKKNISILFMKNDWGWNIAELERLCLVCSRP